MGSRLRENPARLVECWCEVVGPQDNDRPPWILQKFPSSYNDQEILKGVPQFAFPCTFDRSTVQHFSFVLTSLDSKWTYGFCRHAPNQDTALVILSHLPWHQTFYKLLNHLADLMNNDRTNDLTACLQSAYKAPVPPPGSDITIPYASNKFFVGHCPDHRKLPTIPENRNLSEYFNAVDANNMVAIFASMLHERRIIVVSKRVSRLSACVQAANALIYPMQWQHIFIPVLPQHLTDYLTAPMPFVIGVNTSLLSRVQMDDVGEAVILDADNNSVRTPFTDTQALPEEVSQSLRRNLKAANNSLGDGVARAFLRALVQLIGNYKEALQFREEDKRITFSREKFVTSRPSHYQPFVEKMLDLQIFQQFIEERLERLNCGSQTSDEFELEASVYCEKGGGGKVRQQYRQFVTSVRKEGGAIVKTMKSKSPFKPRKETTNPAVKSAVKTVTKGGKQVKERGRQTYKDIRGKFKDLQLPPPRLDDSGSPWMNGEGGIQKPRSAPSSPTHSTRRRPRTAFDDDPPGFSARATYKRSSHTSSRDHRPRKYDLIESGSRGGLMSPDSTDSLSTPSPQSIDLMGEMEEIIRAKLGHHGDLEDEEDEDDDSIESSDGSSSDTSSSYKQHSPESQSASGSTNTVMAANTTTDNTKDTLASHLASRKDGSAQDLIFLESPQDEIFDPLLSKDLPHHPSTARYPLSTSASSSRIPSTSSSSNARSPLNSLSTSASSSRIPSTSPSNPKIHSSSPSSPRNPPSVSPSNPRIPLSTSASTSRIPPSTPSPSSAKLPPSPRAALPLTRPSQPPPGIPTTAASMSATTATKSAPTLPGVEVGEFSLTSSVSAPRLSSSTRGAPINTTGLPNATPARPGTNLGTSLGRYRPFSTLQTSLGAPVGCQNPLYTQHQPPAVLPTGTRAGNAAAAFASRMLNTGGAEGAGTKQTGSYVQFEPPFSLPRSTAMAISVSPTNQTNPMSSLTTSSSAAATPQRPPRLSQKDLLGDFSKDFQKLSLNSSGTVSAAASNNNNNIGNNNKPEEQQQVTEEEKDEELWTTFD